MKVLKSLIHEHSLFFDKLVELIPPKFYLPNDDDADNKPWFQGLSKAAKASLKLQTKQNIKLARRNRLDPEKISESSTLNLLLLKNREKQQVANLPSAEGNDNKSEDDDEEEEVIVKPISLDDDASNKRSVTYEELRQKLRRKIELLRGNRGGEKSVKTDNVKSEMNKTTQERKRKRDENVGGDNVSSSEGIEFGKVKIGNEDNDDGKVGRRKKKKLSKGKELERVKRLQEVKKENVVVATRESWKAAEKRAMGVKVHDDARLIKESMKKEKRKKEKSKEKWKDRVESRDKLKEERQQKRKDNIAERARNKKMRKIAKREKKLMRPGFEGRKEGYITKD